MGPPKDHCYRIKEIRAAPIFPLEIYRTPWRRDCARLIHSPCFRRLQGKTQLYPETETDFFRNRLTHSLEVAQIAKSIAIKLNHDLKSEGKEDFIEPDVTEFAGLAHDLGHPPFGHFGEEILDQKMVDFGGFEGNAQTLRLLTKIEKRHLIENTELGIDSEGKDKRIGLNLTARSIASILKYDNKIPETKATRKGQEGPIKGYYSTEASVVDKVKEKICGGQKPQKSFKTVECQIMDIADDIAYSTYDLEDTFKAGFIRPIELISASEEVLENVARKVVKSIGEEITTKEIQERIRDIFFDIFDPPLRKDIIGSKLTQDIYEGLHFYSIETAHKISNLYAQNGYYRTDLTSKLVGLAIRNISIELNEQLPILSSVELNKDQKVNVEILKHYVYESQILSPKVQIVARRTKEIIETIFDKLSCEEDEGYALLPNDFKQIYLNIQGKSMKQRTICDFVASMTDRYALEFYARLKSENPQTIFKPI